MDFISHHILFGGQADVIHARCQRTAFFVQWQAFAFEDVSCFACAKLPLAHGVFARGKLCRIHFTRCNFIKIIGGNGVNGNFRRLNVEVFKIDFLSRVGAEHQRSPRQGKPRVGLVIAVVEGVGKLIFDGVAVGVSRARQNPHHIVGGWLQSADGQRVVVGVVIPFAFGRGGRRNLHPSFQAVEVHRRNEGNADG